MSDISERIFSVIEDPVLMSLATVTPDGKPWVRYVMGVGGHDLTIRFTTFLGSRKVMHIKSNPEVHIACGVTSPEKAERYLQIQGRGEVSTDPTEKNEMWKDYLQAYFSGPDDPDYCVVIVKPYRIEYVTMTGSSPDVWEAP
ncbi:MAG: pyridoxamine 5'-phosphate oxidase family protein [Chloroflexota bacterium]